MKLFNVKSKTDLSGFYLVFKGSAFLEKEGERGISHLVEHLLCKAMDKYQDEFDKQNINFNAYTSTKEVVFYITGLDEYVNKYRQILLDEITNFSVTQEMLDIEKKIVIGEYKNILTNQEAIHITNLIREKFNFYQPIGLLSDIENCTLDTINSFLLKFKTPSIIVNVSKKSKFKLEKEYKSEIIYLTKRVKEYKNNKYIIEGSSEFNDTTSIINYSKIKNTNNIPYIKFICIMMAGGLKSPLYEEIREKRGLVYSLNLYYYDFTDIDGVLFFSTQTENKNVNEIQNIFNEIMMNPERYLTKERFDIIKENFIIEDKIGDIDRYLRINRYISKKNTTLKPILESITYEKILDVYKQEFMTWNNTTDKENI